MMDESEFFYRPEEDPSYRLAMEEARELGIRVEIYRKGQVQDPNGYWEVRAEWQGQGRTRGEWVNDIWDDSDGIYYGQPEASSAYASSKFPGAAVWSVIRELTNDAI